MNEHINDWIVPDWPAPPTVRALFTTRNGGASAGPYASLNLGDHVGDDLLNVEKNRNLLRQVLPSEPIWLKQVHGTAAVDADNDSCMAPHIGDGAFSRRPGNVCVVLVADCLPILLCDQAGRMVAAIHAGWRGMAEGVIERTLSETGVENTRMMAWLGPAIGPNHFKVGDEVRRAFMRHDAKTATAFTPHPHDDAKWFADLFMLARRRLARAGVDQIYGGGQCTFSDPTRFFSYRRDGTTGRMAALIWLAG